MTQMTADRPASQNGDSPDDGVIDHTKFPYRFAVVLFEEMFVDGTYQRPLTALAKKIASDFDPAMVGTFILNQRKVGVRKFAVIDGQTRMNGMSSAGEIEAPCVVFSGLTRRQEAALFSKLQTQRRNITTYERFRSSLVAKDPVALGVVEVVRRHGFTLDTEPNRDNLRAIGSLESAWHKDPELLDRIMYVIGNAWPDQRGPDTANGKTIPGLDLCLRRHPDVDLDVMVAKLSTINPEILLYRSNSLREGRGGKGSVAGCMAEAIEKAVGLRTVKDGKAKKPAKAGAK